MRLLAALVLAAPAGLFAHATGPDPRLTGAPGDGNCTACHSGTVNSGGGSVTIRPAGGNTYTPGVKQRFQVEVADPTQRRWGFELTARLVSDLTNGQAGTLTPVDGNTQVICDNGNAAPCSDASVVQFIEHTAAGTRNGTTGSAIFEFDWTPPATDAGNIRMYAAGNAANGNNLNTGDHIYTTSIELTAAAAVPRPSISSTNGVVNAACLQSGISANTWITINGSNLATTTRTWTADEIASGAWPTSLDGVSVTINGKTAYVQSVSPTQINALTPADDALGPVEVRVTSNGQTSDAGTATLQSFAPALFTYDDKYLATSSGDNILLTKSARFFNAPDHKSPVKAGDTVTLFGTGLGPASPDDPSTLANTPVVTIGGVNATVNSAGIVPGSPQIYQISITIPDVPDGDQPVVVQVAGVNSPSTPDYGYLTIQHP
jgi:uncharacterized protein (TIGR03437 family)